MADDEILATDTGTVFGVCVDRESVAVCGLTDEGRKQMQEGGNPETWEEWSKWFSLEDLPGELLARVRFG